MRAEAFRQKFIYFEPLGAFRDPRYTRNEAAHSRDSFFACFHEFIESESSRATATFQRAIIGVSVGGLARDFDNCSREASAVLSLILAAPHLRPRPDEFSCVTPRASRGARSDTHRESPKNRQEKGVGRSHVTSDRLPSATGPFDRPGRFPRYRCTGIAPEIGFCALAAVSREISAPLARAGPRLLKRRVSRRRRKGREAESGKDACYETIVCESRRRRRGGWTRRRRAARSTSSLREAVCVLSSSSPVASAGDPPPRLSHPPSYFSFSRPFIPRASFFLLRWVTLLSVSQSQPPTQPSCLPSSSPLPPRRLLRAKIKTRGR